MSTLFEKTAAKISAARWPPDLFEGQDPHKIYREMAKICHPDQAESALRARAEAVFKRLGELYAAATGSISAGSAAQVGDWVVGAPLHKGALCDLYSVSKAGVPGVLKIAHTSIDNPLLEWEAETLRKLYKDGRTDHFQKYIPNVLDSFEASDRHANVLTLAEGYLPLPLIMGALGSAGVPFCHVVWMMNRLLSALGWIHRNGVIHGAVLPHHLLYNPEEHGLVLADWTCSVPCPSRGHIPLLVSRWKNHYPVEVMKKDAFFATDIYMAAKAMEYAAVKIPKRFKGLFEWCLAESPSARPQDAWELQEKWRALAEQEYGKPKFVKLEIPVH